MHGIIKKFKQKLVGNLERRRPLGKPRHRWKDNMKNDVKETVFRGMAKVIWQDFVNTVMDICVP
jgi:hypothetical protein